MKLQGLIIIFIIIFIPILLLFSYYLDLQTTTIKIQTDYDEKLMEATKEAVEAFEINTIEWSGNSFVNIDTGTLANVKRNKLDSSTNVFILGLANKLGIGGTSKQNMLEYIPAIVYIMYDGYYIYSPTYIPQTLTNEKGQQLYYYEDEELSIHAEKNNISGKPLYICNNSTGYTTNQNEAEKTYKHVLKNFVPYTSTITSDKEEQYVINYTLGDYVRVYGKNESREGQIINDIITISPNTIENFKVNNLFIRSRKSL